MADDGAVGWPAANPALLGTAGSKSKNLTGSVGEDMLRRIELERFPITRPQAIGLRSRS